jgi:hypothetical protein
MPRGRVGLRGCLLVGGLRRGIGGGLGVVRGDGAFEMAGGGFPVRVLVVSKEGIETYNG